MRTASFLGWNIAPLPDSSTTDHDVVIISDSDSDEPIIGNREAKAKGFCVKRPADEEHEIKPKIPRLDHRGSDFVSSLSSLSCVKSEVDVKNHSTVIYDSKSIEANSRSIEIDPDKNFSISKVKLETESIPSTTLKIKSEPSENVSGREFSAHSSNVILDRTTLPPTERLHTYEENFLNCSLRGKSKSEHVCTIGNTLHQDEGISVCDKTLIGSSDIAGTKHNSSIAKKLSSPEERSYVITYHDPIATFLSKSGQAGNTNNDTSHASIGGERQKTGEVKQFLLNHNSDNKKCHSIHDSNDSIDPAQEIHSKNESLPKTQAEFKNNLFPRYPPSHPASDKKDEGSKRNTCDKIETFKKCSFPSAAVENRRESVKSTRPDNESKVVDLVEESTSRKGRGDFADVAHNCDIKPKKDVHKGHDGSTSDKHKKESNKHEDSEKSNKTVTASKHHRNNEKSVKEKQDNTKRKETTASGKTNRKHRKEVNNACSTNTIRKESRPKSPVDAPYKRQQSNLPDLDFEADKRLQDVLYGKGVDDKDVKNRGGADHSRPEFDLCKTDPQSSKTKTKDSRKQRILSTSSDTSSESCEKTKIVGKKSLPQISAISDRRNSISSENSEKSSSSRTSSPICFKIGTDTIKTKIDNSNSTGSANFSNQDSHTSSRRRNSSDSLPEVPLQAKETKNSVTTDDELLASIYRNQPIVKLERIDDDPLGTSQQDSQLNYTLDDDIIVISDDEDNMFPSSQVFDEKIMEEVHCKEEILDDSSFNKELEDEDAPLFEEEDEIDADEKEWLARLSQEIIEYEPKSKPSNQNVAEETEVKDVTEASSSKGSTIECFRDNKKEIAVTESEEKSSVKVTKKEEIKNKSKCIGKLLIIDAPPMPPRKASRRGITADEATRIYKGKNEQNQLPTKSNVPAINADQSSKKAKNKKRRSHLSSDDPSLLTAKEKRQIADKRKEKLKALSEKEKAAALAARTSSNKVPANVKIKVTNRNRGAFLVEGAEVSGGNDGDATNLSSAVQKINLGKKEDLSTIASLQENKITQPKKRERSASAPMKNIKDLPRIPKVSRKPSEPSNDIQMENATAATAVPKILTNALPSVPILKTLAPTISTFKTSVKKRVRFKQGSDLQQIKIIPIAEDSRLLPVAHKKDAPPPRKMLPEPPIQKGPDLEEVIHDILCWNPKWLEVGWTEQGTKAFFIYIENASDHVEKYARFYWEWDGLLDELTDKLIINVEDSDTESGEQKTKSASEPPPVAGDKVWPMLSSFTCYNDYLKVLTPLILLNLWSNVTKESELNPNDPRKMPVIVGIDKVDQVPYLTPNQKQLMNIWCHAVLTDIESQRNQHPRVGDLVYLELELENEHTENSQYGGNTNKRRIVPIFAYVKWFNKEAVTGNTRVHKEI
ncbi:hypothetical protein C0J52_05914 [Blattella germanica]|nr:hypothetical protein C0J52_05914 [Blattella germanica]